MKIYITEQKYLIRLRILSKLEPTQSITFSEVTHDECIKRIHSIFKEYTLPSEDKKTLEFRIFENGKNGKIKSFNIYDLSTNKILEIIKTNI